MCEFLSVVSIGDGVARYIPYSVRKNRRSMYGYDPDSHSVICHYLGLRRDGVNCYEMHMDGNGKLHFKVDDRCCRLKRDAGLVENWFKHFSETPEYRRLARQHAAFKPIRAYDRGMFGPRLMPTPAMRKEIISGNYSRIATVPGVTAADWRYVFKRGYGSAVANSCVESLPVCIQRLALKQVPEYLVRVHCPLKPEIQRALVRKYPWAYNALSFHCKGLRKYHRKIWGYDPGVAI